MHKRFATKFVAAHRGDVGGPVAEAYEVDKHIAGRAAKSGSVRQQIPEQLADADYLHASTSHLVAGALSLRAITSHSRVAAPDRELGAEGRDPGAHLHRPRLELDEPDVLRAGGHTSDEGRAEADAEICRRRDAPVIERIIAWLKTIPPVL